MKKDVESYFCICVYDPYCRQVIQGVGNGEIRAHYAAYYRGVYPGKGKVRVYTSEEEYLAAVNLDNERREYNRKLQNRNKMGKD